MSPSAAASACVYGTPKLHKFCSSVDVNVFGLGRLIRSHLERLIRRHLGSNSNGIRTQNHLIRRRTLNHLAKSPWIGRISHHNKMNFQNFLNNSAKKNLTLN